MKEPAVPHVAASLRRFGWQQPIVARRTGEVIAGNTRVKAAQSLGMTEVPVWWFDGTDIDAVAYGIADNRTADYSQFDEPALAALLEQLKAKDSLDGVGYSEDDLDALVQKLREQEKIDRDLLDEGPEEPPVVASAKPGNLWVLGEHRLLCGDSTNLEDVLRVMTARRPRSPRPTRPTSSTTQASDRTIRARTGRRRTARSTSMTPRPPSARCSPSARSARAEGRDLLLHAHKRCGDIQRIWRDLGILDHQQII